MSEKNEIAYLRGEVSALLQRVADVEFQVRGILRREDGRSEYDREMRERDALVERRVDVL